MMMNAERWRRINEILLAALELPAGERTVYLDGACGGDAETRREVESLLAVETDRLERLERGPAAGPPLTGQRVGPYLLEKELGQGGMGAVYAARRVDDEYRHRVAVKVLKRGMDSDEIVRRFRAERRILAALDHPNIARFYDGGTTPDHRPYFVLELIDGRPIDRWCEERGLSVPERLRLFLKVCSAVRAAHRSLVVHRDLKPGNILVTEEGEPKLLDFGIAKLLETGDETATSPERRPMTPGYASPEQIRGEPVTTASDVYSLGVLLRGLLAGERIRPRGDLESVVLKALEPDPRNRYGSAEELAEDLRRYLDGLPVRARQATFLYRTGKLIRRRGRAIAAGLALLAGVAAVAADRVEQHRRTERERDRARRISTFMIGLFEASDVREAGGPAASAREILARGVRQAESELAAEPELQAEVLRTLGEMHRRQGLYDEAAPLLEKALARQRALFGPRHQEVVATLEEIGNLFHDRGDLSAAEARFQEALAMRRELGDPHLHESVMDLGLLRRDQGRLEEAEALYREALDSVRAHHDAQDSVASRYANNLALILFDQGKLDAAEPLFREALEGAQAARGGLNLEAVQAMNNLAVLLQARGDFQEAEPLLRHALTVRRRLLEPGHPEIGESANNLATFLIVRGRFEEAELLAREALAIARESLGADHPRVSMSLNNLAFLLGELERYEEAGDLYREALAVSRAALGEAHPEVAKQNNNLAVLLRRQGRLAEAEPLQRRALELAARELGDDHPETLGYRMNLGFLILLQGDAGTAGREVRTALEGWRRALPADHWRIAYGESVLGSCLLAEGRAAEAEPLLVRGAAVLAAARGERSSVTRDARARLAALRPPSARP